LMRLTVKGDFSFDGTGTVYTANSASFTVDSTGQVTWKSGTFAGEIGLGTETKRPTISIEGAATKYMISGGYVFGALDIYGNTTWTGAGNISLKNSTLAIEGAVFDIHTDAGITDPAEERNSYVLNSPGSTLKKTGGSGTTTIAVKTFTNSAIFQL